jgi:cytochrome d ubiquinol oxidase subunit II
VPFEFDGELRMAYHGGFFGLLSPFALLCGLVSLAMVAMHGAVYLTNKTDGAVAARARRVVPVAALALIVLFSLAGLWVAFGLDGYAIASAPATDGPSNPLLKTVAQASGAWLGNYGRMPLAIGVPALGYAGALLAVALTAAARPGLAFIASSLSTAGVVGTVGVSTFPFLLPSSSHPGSSLTVWDASSSRLTLLIMAGVTIIFMPVVLAYTSWVFAVLRGAVTERDIESEGHMY